MGFDDKTASNCTNNFENAALFGINAALIHIEYKPRVSIVTLMNEVSLNANSLNQLTLD